MDDPRGDFSEDLKDVKAGLDVGSILKALNEPQLGSQRAQAKKPPALKHPEALSPKLSSAGQRGLRSAGTRQTVAASRGGLQNVTTRLTPETNELLTRAALQQQLKKVQPATRQDIIEEALGEWLKRRGYSQPVARGVSPGEPQAFDDEDEAVTP